MAEPPVVNASPLIFLSRAGLMDILLLVGERVIVPAPVAREIQRRGADDITARAIDQTPWLEVVVPPPVPAAVLAWDLGPGESSVLAWALANPGTEAILDDLAARRCASTVGVPVRGTLGLVLVAKKRGRVPIARPVLEDLRRSGMYLSDSVLDQALALVDE